MQKNVDISSNGNGGSSIDFESIDKQSKLLPNKSINLAMINNQKIRQIDSDALLNQESKLGQ